MGRAPTRSTIVQPGPVHSGLAAELEHLFEALVRWRAWQTGV